jgi:hypothetical protein
MDGQQYRLAFDARREMLTLLIAWWMRTRWVLGVDVLSDVTPEPILVLSTCSIG